LSCFCSAQKSKNFVSRARTTPLRSVVLPAWGPKEPDYAVPLPPGDPAPRLASGLPGLQSRASPPSARWLADSRCLRFVSTQKQAPRSGNKSNRSPQPSPTKEKDQKGLCKAVAAVAGCFARASSVRWCPPTPRAGPAQVADLATRRCPRQPKAAPTRQCLVSVLCRSAKTSFPEARTTALRSVVLPRLKSFCFHLMATAQILSGSLW
jgi:hypothetical protein